MGLTRVSGFEEGLQVVPDRDGPRSADDIREEKIHSPNNMPRTVPFHPDDYHRMNDPNYTPAYKFVAENADSHAMSITPPSTLEGPVSPRVCGLRRRTFWILTTVVALVVVCSIIGGVAGGLASRKKDTAPAAGATGAATAENTTTTAASQVPTSVTRTSTASGDGTRTTLLMTPTQTLLSDCPSSNNTIYSVQQDGNILSYVKFCGADIGRNPDKHLSIHQYTDSLDDCIKLCADPPEKASGTGRDPCRAVCWRNTRKFGVGAGFCYGFAAPGAKPANHWLTDFDAPYCDSAVFLGNGTIDSASLP